LAEDLAREAQRFEVEEAAFEERVDALAPVIWGELTKHDPNTWPEMSVHSLEGAKDVARVALVWMDAQAPQDAEPESWATWQEVPDGIEYVSSNPKYVDMWRNESGTRLIYVGYRRWVPYGPGDSPAAYVPFVRADG
jgi:hypothetical protein